MYRQLMLGGLYVFAIDTNVNSNLARQEVDGVAAPVVDGFVGASGQRFVVVSRQDPLPIEQLEPEYVRVRHRSATGGRLEVKGFTGVSHEILDRPSISHGACFDFKWL